MEIIKLVNGVGVLPLPIKAMSDFITIFSFLDWDAHALHDFVYLRYYSVRQLYLFYFLLLVCSKIILTFLI